MRRCPLTKRTLASGHFARSISLSRHMALLADQLDLARPPGLVEERLERAVETEAGKVAPEGLGGFRQYQVEV